MTNCVNCGSSTLNPKFCSRSCSASFTNRASPKRKRLEVSLCPVCENPVKRRNTYCSSSCYGKTMMKSGSSVAKNASRESYNAYMKDYMLSRYYRRKIAAIEQLGGCCCRCGSIEALEFNHIDRTTKSFTIGSSLNSIREDLLQKELLKCQLLCGSCHIQKSRECGDCSVGGGHNKIENPEHGTSAMYGRLKCRCDTCKKWKCLYRIHKVDSMGNAK